MQLIFFILVLCYHIQNATSDPPPQANTPWRRSRYIIDNRRNALFSKKLLPSPIDQTSFKQRLFPVERYNKDLAAEASISEPKFYRKYGENSLPRKILKSYKLTQSNPNDYKYNGIFEGQRSNTTGVLENQNFLQEEVLNDVTASKIATTTEKVLTWVPKINDGVLVPVSSSTTTPKDERRSSEFEYGLPTTTTYPWEITKTDEGNQIDSSNEKHVYETRIETVSYHQEVIFNPPKYREEDKQGNYEEPEKNYEEPERNYEEPEKNYEEPERNFEEPEKNYEEPERNYEEPERSYEESERNYEEPEKNYELDEAMNVMSEGQNQNKFGYVVEGTNYRKYRVEERTADGFIVGEYGVVSHDDGSLRGVRYTADGNTNPKLIYETLIKFLSL